MAKAAQKPTEEYVPPFGWQIAAKHADDFVLVRRGNESAVMHYCGVYSPKVMYHFCIWEGNEATCQSCGGTIKLPDQTTGDV